MITSECYRHFRKGLHKSPEKAAKNILDFGYNKQNNKSSSVTSSGLTLKSNEMHYIIEVFKSLKNRGILLKRTTKKGINQRR